MENQKQGTFQNIEAVYTENLTFWELMILGKLLPMVRLSDADFCDYPLPLDVFFEVQTIDNKRVNNEISLAASRLLERKISWSYFDKNGQIHQCQTTFLTSFDFLTNVNLLSLDVTIHPKFKTLLMSLKSNAASFDFLQLPFLKMCMSHRLYLLLLQNITQNLNSYTINLEKLKGLLGVSGKYSLYANFKIKILEEAQKKMLHDAQIGFDFGEIKTGKKVSAIRFRIDRHLLLPIFENESNEALVLPDLSSPLIEEKPVLAIENTHKSPVEEDLKQKICERFGVTRRMIKKLSEEFSQESLHQAMVLTEKAIEKGSIKGSAAGFFVEAVRQNYQVTEEDEQAKRQAEVRQKAEALAQIEAEKRQQRESLRKQEFEQERDAIIEELALSKTLQQTISERIRYSIFHASFDISKSFEENLENPSFVAAVLNFYKIIKK